MFMNPKSDIDLIAVVCGMILSQYCESKDCATCPYLIDISSDFNEYGCVLSDRPVNDWFKEGDLK